MNCNFFHEWSKWKDIGQGSNVETHIPTGKDYIVGTFIKQERRCIKCNKVELRRVDLNI